MFVVPAEERKTSPPFCWQRVLVHWCVAAINSHMVHATCAPNNSQINCRYVWTL